MTIKLINILLGKGCVVALALILCSVATPLELWASLGTPVQVQLPDVARKIEDVGPGVRHIHEFLTSGPVNIHVLEIDLETSGLYLTPQFGKGRLFTGAKVQEMALASERDDRHVIGAVNADFWKNSPKLFTPVNLTVLDGMVARLPNAPAPRAIFAKTLSGRYVMVAAPASLTLTANGRRLGQVKLNEPFTSSSAVIYNRHYGGEISLTRFARAYELELVSPRFIPNEPAVARVVRKLEESTVTVSGRTLVLGLHRDAARQLPRLSTEALVRLDLRIPHVKEPLEFAVGGGPLLLRDGRPFIDWREEKILKSFVENQHPRTAVGVSRDGKKLYLVTVDGRQPAVSIGMSLYELAQYLRALGCWTAMNFDGGGSTTMVVRGEVVNKPSDRLGPRSVGNGLLVMHEGPAGPLTRLELLPRLAPLRVPAGTQLTLECRGCDAQGNTVELSPSRIRWITEYGVGSLDPHGTTCTLTAATNACTGTLTVVYELPSGKQLSAAATVSVQRVTSLVFEPSPILLSAGEQLVPKIEAKTAEGPLDLTFSMLRYFTTDPNVTVTKHGIKGLRRGEGCLEIEFGTYRTEVPYYVDHVTTRMVCSFDRATTARLQGTRFDLRKSQVCLDQMRQREGRGCLAWQYAMTKGGTSKIILPVSWEIEGRPSKLSLWIWGDGKEAWLRGEVVDAAGKHFLLDFTEGSVGITWKNQWKQVIVPLHTLAPRPSNPGAKPQFPIKVTQLYLAQDQEALKASGLILLDAFEALSPPENSPLKCGGSGR
ncbi:MAG: phosphodiester glycosidase family protein [Candidatus Sumerlaeaceae bacterium]